MISNDQTSCYPGRATRLISRQDKNRHFGALDRSVRKEEKQSRWRSAGWMFSRKREFPDRSWLVRFPLPESRRAFRRIPPNIRDIVYCTGVSLMDEDVWEFIWMKFHSSNAVSEKKILLEALTCSDNVFLLNRYKRKDQSRLGLDQSSAVIWSFYRGRCGTIRLLSCVPDSPDRLRSRPIRSCRPIVFSKLLLKTPKSKSIFRAIWTLKLHTERRRCRLIFLPDVCQTGRHRASKLRSSSEVPLLLFQEFSAENGS